MHWGEKHEPVERAVRTVARELFVPPEQRAYARQDTALPIGCGQTISQPSLVRFMTAQLELTPTACVLEIGTGSGYQTAILAELAAEVYTIERLPELAERARTILAKLGYGRIAFRIGDGALGWPEAAPFDAIVVTAAAAQLPPALVEQLASGGRLVAPLGGVHEEQMLYRFTKDQQGNIHRRALCGVRFVPLVTGTQP